MKKWEVTFTGDDWKLIVSVDFEDEKGDTYDLIEKAKEVANAGECKIKVEGYYLVQESEVI
jgi:hypothetical protein